MTKRYGFGPINLADYEQPDGQFVLASDLDEAHERVSILERDNWTCFEHIKGLDVEINRLKAIIAAFPDNNCWTCPDCQSFAKNGCICPGCGLNHPKQSPNYKEPQ